MTLRQTYIAELRDRIQAAPGMAATVERSMARAFTREDGTVLVVHRGAEQVTEKTLNGVTSRDCEILLTVITRGEDPEAAADEVLAVAHPIVMAYDHLGVFAVIEERTDEPRLLDADGEACVTSARYVIRYQTSPNSLTG